VGGPVLVHDLGVVDGDVAGLLVEVADRVAARAHHLGHQHVRRPHRFGRPVDEVCLGRGPPGGEGLPVARGQRPDVQRRAVLGAGGEVPLGVAPAAAAFEGAVVLGAEGAAQLLAAALLLRRHQRGHDRQHDEDDDDQDDDLVGFHGDSSDGGPGTHRTRGAHQRRWRKGAACDTDAEMGGRREPYPRDRGLSPSGQVVSPISGACGAAPPARR
jgi:hypothetical protein